MVVPLKALTIKVWAHERQQQGARSKDLEREPISPVLIRNPASKLGNILRAPVVQN